MSCSVEECSLITHRWRGRNRGSQKENDGEEMRERERFIESSGMSEKLSGGLVDNVLSLLLSLFLIVSLFLNFLKLVTRSEKNIPSLYQWIKLNVMNNNSWRNCNVPNIQIHRERTVIMQASTGSFFRLFPYAVLLERWNVISSDMFSTNNYEETHWCSQKALTVHLEPLSTTL